MSIHLPLLRCKMSRLRVPNCETQPKFQTGASLNQLTPRRVFILAYRRDTATAPHSTESPVYPGSINDLKDTYNARRLAHDGNRRKIQQQRGKNASAYVSSRTYHTVKLNMAHAHGKLLYFPPPPPPPSRDYLHKTTQHIGSHKTAGSRGPSKASPRNLKS